MKTGISCHKNVAEDSRGSKSKVKVKCCILNVFINIIINSKENDGELPVNYYEPVPEF
jgi:hypothetical protein